MFSFQFLFIPVTNLDDTKTIFDNQTTNLVMVIICLYVGSKTPMNEGYHLEVGHFHLCIEDMSAVILISYWLLHLDNCLFVDFDIDYTIPCLL
jgi:hypothetical protein